MTELVIPVRYYRLNTDLDVPAREENFAPVTLTWALPVAQTALVLIDCWDINYIESHLGRNRRVVADVLAPLVRACRAAGITIIHAPSPQTAAKYPQSLMYAGDEELFGNYEPPAWPPEDFRRRQGDYARYAYPPEPRYDQLERDKLARNIMPVLGPEPGDFVVANGPQLHRLCRHRRLLHLLYAGFAANICVLNRDYGTRAMGLRGYNIILVRDATNAVECHDTVQDEGMKWWAIRWLEMLIGTTTTSADVLAACRAATDRA